MDQANARHIASSQWPPNALWVRAGRLGSGLPKWLTNQRNQGALFIGAHDILDDKADWKSETWLFDPAALHRFIATLERLYELLPEKFELVAVWGDKPSREQLVTRTQLLTILSNNTLGNTVLYRVGEG
jgi:hypothetical protein